MTKSWRRGTGGTRPKQALDELATEEEEVEAEVLRCVGWEPKQPPVTTFYERLRKDLSSLKDSTGAGGGRGAMGGGGGRKRDPLKDCERASYA